MVLLTGEVITNFNFELDVKDLTMGILKDILDWFKNRNQIPENEKENIAFTIQEYLKNGNYKVIQGIFTESTEEILYEEGEVETLIEAVKTRTEIQYKIGYTNNTSDSPIIQGENNKINTINNHHLNKITNNEDIKNISINNCTINLTLKLSDSEIFCEELKDICRELKDIYRELKNLDKRIEQMIQGRTIKVNSENDYELQVAIKKLEVTINEKEELSNRLINSLLNRGIDYNEFQKAYKNTIE
jgi:hypothetical protein